MEHSSQLATVATGVKNPIVIALIQGKKVSDMDRNKLNIELVNIITRSYFIKGYNSVGANDLDLIVQETAAIILEKYNYLTIEEIAIAFRKGAYGNYGEVRGLSPSTFYEWLGTYIMQERKEAKKALPQPEIKAKEETKEDKELFNATLIKQFKKFKETGVLEIISAKYLYKIYEDSGRINLSIEDKNAIYEIAKKEVYAQLKNERVKKGGFKIKEISDVLKRIDTNETNNTDKARIISHAKFLAIKRYYESIDELLF